MYSQLLDNVVDLAAAVGAVLAEMLRPAKMFARGFEAVRSAIENYVMCSALHIVEKAFKLQDLPFVVGFTTLVDVVKLDLSISQWCGRGGQALPLWSSRWWR